MYGTVCKAEPARQGEDDEQDAGAKKAAQNGLHVCTVYGLQFMVYWAYGLHGVYGVCIMCMAHVVYMLCTACIPFAGV